MPKPPADMPEPAPAPAAAAKVRLRPATTAQRLRVLEARTKEAESFVDGAWLMLISVLPTLFRAATHDVLRQFVPAGVLDELDGQP